MGCGAPISNQAFLEEALFLGALPSSDRYEAPRNVFLAPNGDNPVLAAAKGAAAIWEEAGLVMVIVGERLRETPATERDDFTRRWGPTELLSVLPADLGAPPDAVTMWIQGEILKGPGDDVELSIQLAAAEDGPYEDVASGTFDGEGRGTLSWSLALTAQALGFPEGPNVLGTLVTDYDDHVEDTDTRHVEVVHELAPGVTTEVWVLEGDSILGFGAEFEVTDDGLSWPGGASVSHTPDGGGWCTGTLVKEPKDATFRSCWDNNGNTLFSDGTGNVLRTGGEDNCWSEDPFGG